MHAAVAEVPVDEAVKAVVPHQGLEVPQVGAQPRGRHRGVLPSRPRRGPGWGPATEARPVLPDTPQRGGVRPGDDRVADSVRVGRQLLGRGDGLRRRLARHLDEQPPLAAWEAGHGGRPSAAPDDRYQARVHAF